MTDSKNEQQGIVTRSTDFLNQSVAELKKVTAPTRQETIQATLVVLVMMVLISLYLGALDLIFKQLMDSVL